MEEYIDAFKKKKHNVVDIKDYKKLKVLLSRFLIGVIFFLVSIIFTNLSDKNLLFYKEHVFRDTLPFNNIKNWYEDKFGKIIPDNNNVQTVFDEKLIYKEIKDYKDGEELLVVDKSLVNSMASGVVVFIGNKDDYGNTLIIQGVDGYDIWYGNIENTSYRLYDYVEKGSVIGNTIDDKLYLVISKDKNYIKYEDYQN